MTSPARENYADVEVAMLDWLETTFPTRFAPVNGAVRADIEAPVDLRARLPFARVRRVDGADDGITDFAVVDVDVFSPDRQSGYDAAEDIRGRFLKSPHVVNGVVLDAVYTETAPHRVPWDGEVSRHLATYRVSARR